MHNSGIASHQKALSKDKRVVILTRSGFIGQQRYGCNTWSGDVTSTWDMLEKTDSCRTELHLNGHSELETVT